MLNILKGQNIKNTEKLIENKKKIYKIVYEKNLARCLWHGELYTDCIKIDDIKEFIEKPKIFRFLFYN